MYLYDPDPTLGGAGPRFNRQLQDFKVGNPQAIPERCKTPKICPEVTHRAAPFQRINGVGIYDHKGNLRTVSRVEQALKDGLANFLRDAQSLVFGPSGLQIVGLTMGDYNCRCTSGKDRLSGHAFGRAADIYGWSFRKGETGATQKVVYKQLVQSGMWAPLSRIGACLHLNFRQVLNWSDPNHRDHFHAEVGTPAPAAFWRFIDSGLSFMLGESLLGLGWKRSGNQYVPASAKGPALVKARVAALGEFAKRVPAGATDLFTRRLGVTPKHEAGDLSKLLLLSIATNGFRISSQPSSRPAAPSPLPKSPGTPSLSPKHPPGFTPVKRKGVIRGLSRYGGDRLDRKLLSLKSQSVLSVSNENIDTFQRIANVETGGLVQGINTWDSAVVSLGFMQLTLQHGKLQEWIKNAEAAFQRYGIALDNRKYEWSDKSGKVTTQQAIKGALTKDELRWDGWAERFFSAGLDSDIIVAEVNLASLWLERHLNSFMRRLTKANLRDDFLLFKTHYDKSLQIRGIFQAAYNNLPLAAIRGTTNALQRARPTGAARTEDFLKIFKDEILKAYVSLNDNGTRIITETVKGAKFE